MAVNSDEIKDKKFDIYIPSQITLIREITLAVYLRILFKVQVSIVRLQSEANVHVR